MSAATPNASDERPARIAAVLNVDSGTLRTVDLYSLEKRLADAFTAQGYTLDCMAVDGASFDQAVQQAAASADILMAVGGDGSVSLAARCCWERHKILGVLPAGTMNLIARSLGIAENLDEAIESLARGRIAPCDIASANGISFMHQFSAGLQEAVVAERNRGHYHSRFSKILASVRATLPFLYRPPSFTVTWQANGLRRRQRLSILTVSNNPYGKGHMPYADMPDQGVLGFYRARALEPIPAIRLTADLLSGQWSGNPDLIEDICTEVALEFPRGRSAIKALLDGEIVSLQRKLAIKIHHHALRVLVPGTSET